MTDQERRIMYIANCKACTLAEAMKACQVCRFRVGLEIKAAKEKEKEIKGNE